MGRVVCFPCWKNRGTQILVWKSRHTVDRTLREHKNVNSLVRADYFASYVFRIVVRRSHDCSGTARNEEYFQQSNFVRNGNLRAYSRLSNVWTRGIDSYDSKKYGYQSGGLAGFRSQEHALIKSGSVETGRSSEEQEILAGTHSESLIDLPSCGRFLLSVCR